jgi:hypothetical protein
VWLLESPLAGLALAKGMRDSGIPQAMRELDVPEQATFQPLWPVPAPAAQEERDAVVVQGLDVRERLNRAAQAIPGVLLLCFHPSPLQTTLTCRWHHPAGPARLHSVHGK